MWDIFFIIFFGALAAGVIVVFVALFRLAKEEIDMRASHYHQALFCRRCDQFTWVWIPKGKSIDEWMEEQDHEKCTFGFHNYYIKCPNCGGMSLGG